MNVYFFLEDCSYDRIQRYICYLYFCCSLFQIMRDPDTGNSRGFGFISYDSFEASDAAIEVFAFC